MVGLSISESLTLFEMRSLILSAAALGATTAQSPPAPHRAASDPGSEVLASYETNFASDSLMISDNKAATSPPQLGSTDKTTHKSRGTAPGDSSNIHASTVSAMDSSECSASIERAVSQICGASAPRHARASCAQPKHRAPCSSSGPTTSSTRSRRAAPLNSIAGVARNECL